MTTVSPETLSDAPVRCAVWARDEALDPIGTAGLYSAYVLVEWPLPWPRDIGEIPELAALQGLLSGTGTRLQALVPTGTGPRRVALYRRTDPFTGYRRKETAITTTPEAAVATLLDAMAEVPTPDDLGAGHHEVLVCTHGRRDRCCGSLGTALHKSLEEAQALGPAVTLHRTSHTGGHRFAPTVLVLPEGTMWAFANADLLSRVIARRGPLDDVLPRYRGCTGLASRSQQAVERAVLGQVGWDLFGMARRGEDVDGTTHLSVTEADGTVTTWAAEVSTGRRVTTPECGSPIADATKFETELVVSDLRTLS